MKKMVVLLGIAACLLSGCGRKEEPVNAGLSSPNGEIQVEEILVEEILVEGIQVEGIQVATWDSQTTSWEDF